MITRGFAPATPGQPLGNSAFDASRIITAKSLNDPSKEVEKFGKLRGGAGVYVTDTPGGPQVGFLTVGTMYIQLTGPAADDGGYPWQEVIRVFEGGFVPNGNVGMNVVGQPRYAPAYESQTGDTTLTADGTTYFAQTSKTSGQWLFDGKN